MGDALAPDGYFYGLTRSLLLSVGCLVAWAPCASAAGSQPRVEAAISIELEDDYIVRSEEAQNELNDAYATIESEISIAFPSGTGLYASATLEPVTNPTGDRFFEDLGLYLEELYLLFQSGDLGLRAGKFNPPFDIGNDLTPGLYGDRFASVYELTEKIGAGLDYALQALDGTHVASAAVFMADTTPLSDSLITSRGRLRRGDGGVSNTGAPESLALALAGEIDRSGYNLALRYQAANQADERDEYGGVIGLVQGFEAGRIEATLFAEAAYFPQFDGAGDGTGFLTLAAEAGLDDARLSVTYGLRDSENAPTDRFATASLKYDVSAGLSIGAGYLYAVEDNVASHMVGLLLTYYFSLR